MCITKSDLDQRLDEKFDILAEKMRGQFRLVNWRLGEIKAKVYDTNGRVGKAETTIRNLQEDSRHKIETCPHSTTITQLHQQYLTETSLRTYLETQEEERKERESRNYYKVKTWMAVFSVLLSALVLALNILV